MDVYDSYIAAAETRPRGCHGRGIYSDGTANGGKQITGLATAVPIVTNSGVYGGIDRGTAMIWQTKTYDANSFLAGSTQVSATTIRPMLNYVMTKQSRGKDYADLLVMSPEHYAAYDAATVAIQRQTNATIAGPAWFQCDRIYRRRQARRDRARRRHRLQHAGQHHIRIEYRQFPACGITRTETSTTCSMATGRCRSTRTRSRSSSAGWVNSPMVNPMFNWRLYDSNPAA